MATICTINVVAGEYNFTLSPKYKKVKIFIHSEFEIDSLCITSPSKAGHCIQIQPGESYDDVIIKKLKLKGEKFCIHRSNDCFIETMKISCNSVTYDNDVIESCD